MKRHVSLSLTFGLLLLLPTTPAHAQANYDAALIGGRSSLFGGTGVATGADAAAPLQNPATTVDIQGTSFVFSTIFLQLTQQRFDGIEDERPNTELTKGNADLSQINFRILPNSTCLFLDIGKKDNARRGRDKLSVCIAEPERDEFTGSAQGVYTINGQDTWYRDRDIYYLFSKRVYAAGWAHAFTNELSFGFTPMLQQITYRDRETLATLTAAAPAVDQVVGSAGANYTTQMSQSAKGYSGSILAGVQYRPSKDFQAGLSFESPAFHIYGTYHASRSAEVLQGTTEQYSQEDGTARFQYPFRLALGLAKTWKAFSIEISSYLHGARDNFAVIDATRTTATVENDQISDLSPATSTRRERALPTANFGIGVEVPVDKEWSLLFGALTDFSGLEKRTAGAPSDNTLFRNQNDLFHGSIGVSWNPPLGHILFGFRGYYGTGGLSVSSALGPTSDRIVLQETLWGLSIVLSGQLSLQMLSVAAPTAPAEKKPAEATPATSAENTEASAVSRRP